MNTNVVKLESNLPAAAPEGAWEEQAPVSHNELLLPKLLLMQGQSKLVAAEKCKSGEIVNSVTGQIFGGKGKSVEFVPFMKMPSVWVIQDPKQDKKFLRVEAVTPENVNHDWVVKDKNGNPLENWVYTLSYMVLVTSDLKAFPYVLQFRMTSLRSGKALASHFQLCAQHKEAPARYALKLDSHQEMNPEKKPYYVFDLGDKRKSTAAEYDAAYTWFKSLKGKNVKVDDSDLADSANEATDSEVPF